MKCKLLFNLRAHLDSFFFFPQIHCCSIAKAGHFKNKVKEARLKWLTHVQRRDCGHTGGRMIKMELPDRRQKRRIKEETHGCGENGQTDSWFENTRCRGPGEMEEDDFLYRLLEKVR